jgi:hypothetical protein
VIRQREARVTSARPSAADVTSRPGSADADRARVAGVRQQVGGESREIGQEAVRGVVRGPSIASGAVTMVAT